MTHRRAYPLALALPGGVLAAHVAGSDPPQYAIDGAPIAVDVAIPADLAALGWRWHGTFLSCDSGDAQRPVMICTSTYPPPGWPSERRDCFAVARGIDWSPIAPAQPTKPKPTRRAKPETQDSASPRPMQLSLFEEATNV